MAAVIDPVETGLVPSLHRPGGNLTGLTFFVFELYAKRVELIREAIPTLMRAAVLINPANPAQFMGVPVMQRTASALGVELVLLEIKARDDIAPAVATATRRAQALVAIEEPLTISNAKQIADLALQWRNRRDEIDYAGSTHLFEKSSGSSDVKTDMRVVTPSTNSTTIVGPARSVRLGFDFNFGLETR
jgi:hypothetical protein